MQTPAIETVAAPGKPLIATSPTAPEAIADAASSWHCLPLHTLANFELVNHQFASQQVCFESAIALRPSNPRFQINKSSLTLMAFYHKAGLKIDIGPAIAELDVGFISVEPLIISTLDADGHCVSIVKTAELPALPQPEPGKPNQHFIQGVTLAAHGVKTLRIHSMAPFVLTRFWINQADLSAVA
ncbi:MAG: hypothetical protein AAGF98_15860 [Cyanobacteria bacterium P01_H01_bin.153]